MRKPSGPIDYWSKDPGPTLPPLLLSEKHAADMLGICPRSLFDLQRRGLIVARQLGGRKLYHIDDVRRYAAALPPYPADNASGQTEA